MAAITFSGLASGIDSTALIKSLLDQKRKASIDPLASKISSLEETNSSFEKLSELLESLKSSAYKFRQVSGGILAKTLTSSDETNVTGSASNSASNGSYQINVITKAKNDTHSFNDRFAATSSIINSNINNGDPTLDRTVSYTIGTGAEQETVDITLTNTTTADQFVSQFNSQSENATASIVNVGTSASPSYAIVVNSNNEGTSKGSIAVSVGARVTDPNNDTITTDGAFVTATQSAATDAEFTVTGIAGTITRSTNSVTDVIGGVTLEIQDTGTSILTVGDDSARTTSSLQDFIDAYNEVVQFINENDTITREEQDDQVVNIFGPLANTSLDDNILSTLRSSLSNAGLSGRSVNILADLGITTQRDGTLAFDSDQFEEALANDSEAVRLITENLGEDLASVDGTIANFTKFNGLIDLAKTSNSTSIASAQDRIDQVEKLLTKEEESLNARFARLESLIGRLNSQQSQLASLLP